MTTQTLLRTLAASSALAALAAPACAQFLRTDAGPYDFNDTANWNGTTINNTWGTSLTANQTVYFGADTTLASTTLGITNTSVYDHTFIGSGGDRTITLGGNLSLASNSSNSNTNKVTIGSGSTGTKLNIDLGGSTRTMFAGTNRTLEILDAISGTGGITKTGAGTLKLTHTANSFTGGFGLGASGVFGGTVEVTKLADGGQSSSIGAGSSITFGGSGGASTLRYVGSGDSSNRTFVIGSQGAIIESSGTGALKFTGSSAIDVSPSSTVARTMTFTGTNTADNTFAGVIKDPSSAQTSLLKQGVGRWILTGANTYTGTTTIDQGTLELGAANRISDSSSLVMNGGTFATGGFSESLGTLILSASSTIDLGSGASALVFTGAGTWGSSISLSFVNFTDGVDSIRIGTSAAALSSTQLAQITINGFAASIDGSGYLSISNIPEPSCFALIGGAAGLLVATARRRPIRS